jgi:hypothetical protein
MAAGVSAREERGLRERHDEKVAEKMRGALAPMLPSTDCR